MRLNRDTETETQKRGGGYLTPRYMGEGENHPRGPFDSFKL